MSFLNHSIILLAALSSVVAQTVHYDLNGIWLRDDGQPTSIKQVGTALIAVKLAGGYVAAGDVTWEGDYTSSSFTGRIRVGDGKGHTSWVPVRIVVQDANTIHVTGLNVNRSYVRERADSAPNGHDVRITIYREYPGSACTSGYLAVNGRLIVYTLERPWKDNQKNISSIPAGTYPAFLRYDHADHWRIELQEVPGRADVQIHIGNEPDQSKGCILVGMRLNSGLCSIAGGTSAPAYSALKKAFYGAEYTSPAPEKKITVDLTDAGPR